MTRRHTIMACVYGSTLYGTAMPESDVDIHAVHIPDGDAILLGVASRALPADQALLAEAGARFGSPAAAKGPEGSSFSLAFFMNMLADNNVIALEMLFAPDRFLIGRTDPLLHEIRENRHRFLNRKASSFLGYINAQANVYRRKGDRLATMNAMAELCAAIVEKSGGNARLADHQDEILALNTQIGQQAATSDGAGRGKPAIRILPPTPDQGPGSIGMLNVSGTRLHLTCTASHTRKVLESAVAKYGERTRAAAANPQKADMKAVAHAIRIALEAEEYFKTGFITMPRPEAETLKAIRTGRIGLDAATNMMEEAFSRAEDAIESSTLPAEPDRAYVDGLVIREYRRATRDGSEDDAEVGAKT